MLSNKTKAEDAPIQSLEQEQLFTEQRPAEAQSLDEPSNQEAADTEKQDPWHFLNPYHASYTITSKGDTYGHATRDLGFRNNQWQLSTIAKIRKFIISVNSIETSNFHIINGLLLSQHFDSNLKITFKKTRRIEQDFDWNNKVETGKSKKKSWQLPLEKQVFDRISHILQIRADLLAGKEIFNYEISHKGKFKIYSYLVEKEELIKTSMGEFPTLKLVRKKSNGDLFVVWFSPELEYFPVKIAQYEVDEPEIVLTLETLESLKRLKPLESIDGQENRLKESI